MTDEVLLDTNVLVYAFDPSGPTKHERALRVIARLLASGRGKISCQALGEFFWTVTRKMRPPLRPSEAYDQIAILMRTWPVLPTTPLVVLEAARGVRDHRLPYWDAQVWAAARLNQIPVILSEDFSDGSEVDGVRFVNPFVRTFDWALLGT